jgi:hypothetical protein
MQMKHWDALRFAEKTPTSPAASQCPSPRGRPPLSSLFLPPLPVDHRPPGWEWNVSRRTVRRASFSNCSQTARDRSGGVGMSSAPHGQRGCLDLRWLNPKERAGSRGGTGAVCKCASVQFPRLSFLPSLCPWILCLLLLLLLWSSNRQATDQAVRKGKRRKNREQTCGEEKGEDSTISTSERYRCQRPASSPPSGARTLRALSVGAQCTLVCCRWLMMV